MSDGKILPGGFFSATGGRQINLSELKNVVMYFYPKDNTPGCTQEGRDAADLYPKIRKLGVEIFGVSGDSLKSHEKFKAEQKFPFDLISDPDRKLCQALNVLKEKSLYGKKYIGIERSTFVIDKQGRIVREWRDVKVEGHIQEVVNFLKTLS